MDLVSERNKTVWEKEEMLLTSIFSFSYDVLKSFLPRGTLNHVIVRQRIKQITCELPLLELIFQKKVIHPLVIQKRREYDFFFLSQARHEQFLLFPQFFYSIRKLYPHLSIFMTSYLYLLLIWKS